MRTNGLRLLLLLPALFLLSSCEIIIGEIVDSGLENLEQEHFLQVQVYNASTNTEVEGAFVSLHWEQADANGGLNPIQIYEETLPNGTATFYDPPRGRILWVRTEVGGTTVIRGTEIITRRENYLEVPIL